MEKAITKAKFQQMLNSQDMEQRGNQHNNLVDPFRNNQYGPTKRLYGDYLRSQDPDMFNQDFGRYLRGDEDMQYLKKYE